MHIKWHNMCIEMDSSMTSIEFRQPTKRLINTAQKYAPDWLVTIN